MGRLQYLFLPFILQTCAVLQLVPYHVAAYLIPLEVSREPVRRHFELFWQPDSFGENAVSEKQICNVLLFFFAVCADVLSAAAIIWGIF